ncbi:hypothetical protein GQ43DRAFT_417147 [Delitschia confertaspora ATCC 74209]|uniref:C2H2-type domain-containing protein n=1 Tax=Delitschia confertaspora ATCC 74209 TaxID=1513339 RepID=A0A9P4JPE6_9PLEO|nr:hypothetical protein GQ43DRAFT_417147 [Delitschia confertaspora ATCC 74209]
MLSNNTTSSIQRRRTQHRRQNSTPAAFDAPKVRPLPATNMRQTRQQRTGMSLDLRGLDLESIRIPELEAAPETPRQAGFFPEENSTVSITNNLGQSPQHPMQVAQTHSQPQPGPQDPFMQSPVHQQSLPSPRTPHRTTVPPSPSRSHSPSKPPTEQQLKELHEHIQSVYGSCGQVFINILPTPTATPQKPVRMPSNDALDTPAMPSSFSDMAEISLDPPAHFNIDFEHQDNEIGYESSSYYTSDALSPSPGSSPEHKSMQSFLDDIQEYPSQSMPFAQGPSLLPAMSANSSLNGYSSVPESYSKPAPLPDLDVDATIEYTGITAEEVQRFISEQDPVTGKWTCLYPQCDKTFGRRENIRSHVQTHLGDRQYRCNGCGKCFVRQHDLKRHAKIHTGNKPYKCPCGAGFARQDALTRHRQRGMCVGGFPDAVRRQAKRGRPKKNRPDMEERVSKATRTRRALASAASSVSAESPRSDGQAIGQSPGPLEPYDLLDTKLMPNMASFGGSQITSTDPFSFDSATSPFSNDAHIKTESFASTSSFPGDSTSMNLLQQLSNTTTSITSTHTPPMSPGEVLSPTSPSSDRKDSVQFIPSVDYKPQAPSTPARSSVSAQSNPFSTPPTSPVGPPPESEFEELLFNGIPDPNMCAQFEGQFDMEMKAMGDFTQFDSTPYELLDFSSM